MIRFAITQLGAEPFFTDWVEEPVKHGTGPQTAVVAMTELRQRYPDAAIRIERTTVIPKPERQLFRYDVFVRDGYQAVIDKGGERAVHIVNTTVHSRPFQEPERESVVAELREKFPDAKLTEVRL